MPLDATNFSETIPAPLTLDDLIAWLRTKPADETYCYTSSRPMPHLAIPHRARARA